jgi:hypothetical protein
LSTMHLQKLCNKNKIQSSTGKDKTN